MAPVTLAPAPDALSPAALAGDLAARDEATAALLVDHLVEHYPEQLAAPVGVDVIAPDRDVPAPTDRLSAPVLIAPLQPGVFGGTDPRSRTIVKTLFVTGMLSLLPVSGQILMLVMR